MRSEIKSSKNFIIDELTKLSRNSIDDIIISDQDLKRDNFTTGLTQVSVLNYRGILRRITNVK